MVVRSEGRPTKESDVTYKSQAARDAQARNYGTERYWSYLDEACERSRDHWLGKGDEERANHMMTRSLGEALSGNDGL